MTSILMVTGGVPLRGSVPVSGAKNAALPILAATLLCEKPVKLANVPRLNDVTTLLAVLERLGVQVDKTHSTYWSFACPHPTDCHAPYELVRMMRASILVLGPLLARFGYAEVSLPGGCAIGSRPVNLHLAGMEALGAEITVENGVIKARTQGRLKGTRLRPEKITVTGTENLLMAAVLADGTTVIENAALEPEVGDLAHFLNAHGAQISGIGTDCLVIDGVPALTSTDYVHTILPDRIEAGTFLVAGAMTRGRVRVTEVVPETLSAISERLEMAGARMTHGADWVELDMDGVRPRAIDLETAPYPLLPTDVQAQLMALNAVAEGKATIIETIFENRFMHVPELCRMGAQLRVEGNRVFSTGVPHLVAAPVMATDLRASAGLVLAGLVAQGETIIDRIYHLDRGYERLEAKLVTLGAQIQRVSSGVVHS